MIQTKNCNFQFVNGLQGDPAVWVFFPRSGEAALFDVGDVSNLSNKDLLRVRKIFVSHTHIDHFIGFDQVLRVNIPHFRKIDVVGPPGITGNVQGKLKGYLWNLVDKDQVQFKVFEITPANLVETDFTSTDGFKGTEIAKTNINATGANLVATLEDGTSVYAAVFDHGTPTIGYCCKAAKRYHVNEATLSSLGLAPGPWIKQIQTMAANKEITDSVEIDGKTWNTKSLIEKLLEETEPKFLGYMTDLVFSRSNLEQAKKLFEGVEILICESNFAVEHRDRALAKKHLTAKQAAMFARYSNAQNLNVFHISNVYGQEFDAVRVEAEKFFQEFKAMDDNAFNKALIEELK